MMKSKIYLPFLILSFLGLVGWSCTQREQIELPTGAVQETVTPVPSTSVPPTSTTAFTRTPEPTKPTPTPTRTATVTATPYPTTTIVQANAVAFVVGDWQMKEPDSLWIANVDGSGEKLLVDDVGAWTWRYGYNVKWSPNGRWISFIKGGDLWLVSPDDLTQQKILTVDKGKELLREYQWSPDSSQIVYAVYGSGTSIDIPVPAYIALLDLASNTTTELAMFNNSTPIMLEWSPDARYIVLAHDFWLGVIETATGKMETIALACSGMMESLVWSPNNEWIAYTATGNGRYGHRSTCVSGLNQIALYIDVSGTSSNAVWDSTGNYLYVAAQNFNPDNPPLTPDARLLRFDVRTQELERVLSLNEPIMPFGSLVSVSPDGRELALLTGTRPNPRILTIMDLNSNSTISYTVDARILSDYYWSADSQEVIFFAGDTHTPNGIGIRFYGAFYALDICTGQTAVFSGSHWVKGWTISPVLASP